MQNQFWEDLKSGRFAAMVKETAPGERVHSSLMLYNILRPLLAEQDDVEQFYCIFLTAQNTIIAIEKMFSGSITSSPVYPREIVKAALKHKAPAVAFAHNHPSGDPQPSPEDFAITIACAVPLMAMGVAVHDHIIGGGIHYHSMADKGEIARFRRSVEEFLQLNRKTDDKYEPQTLAEYTVIGFWPDTSQKFAEHVRGDNADIVLVNAEIDNPGLIVTAVLPGTHTPADTETRISKF